MGISVPACLMRSMRWSVRRSPTVVQQTWAEYSILGNTPSFNNKNIKYTDATQFARKSLTQVASRSAHTMSVYDQSAAVRLANTSGNVSRKRAGLGTSSGIPRPPCFNDKAHKRRTSHELVHHTVTLKHIAQTAKRTKDARFALYCADKLLKLRTLAEKDSLHAMHIYQQAQQPAKCAEVLEYVKKNRLRLCVGQYNAIIASFGSAKDCDSAYSYYQEMDVHKVTRDNDTHKAMIAAFSRVSRYVEAVTMLRRMQPDVHTYNWIMYACAKDGRWVEAHDLLVQMDRSGIQPNMTTFNNAIAACVRHGKVNEAVKLLDTMQHAGLTPSTTTYCGAISACEVSGRWETAIRLLREMASKGLKYDTDVFAKTVAACEKGQQWDKALGLLREMNVKRIPHNTRTYSSLINLVDWTEAVDLFLDMDTTGLKKDVRTYGALIEALGKEGNMQSDVDRLYDSMVLHIPEAANLWHVFETKGDLDLHHHSYHMAKAAVRRLLRTLLTKEHTWLNKELAKINDDGIKGYRIRSRTRSGRNNVVVGKGLNSVNGPVLMDLVRTQLGLLDPPVAAHTLPKNTGCLILDDNSLNTWLWSNM